MNGIFPDKNIEGPARAMAAFLARSHLAEFWETLALDTRTFRERGWPDDLPDREVWQRCQAGGLILITNNRNDDGPDSLEATLRDSVTPDSLPVVTASDKAALRDDRGYAERVAADLLDLLFDTRFMGRYRGAGRVFLPLPEPLPEA